MIAGPSTLRDRAHAHIELRRLARWYTAEVEWDLLLDPRLADAVLAQADQLRAALAQYGMIPGTRSANTFLAGFRRSYLEALDNCGSAPPEPARDVNLLAVAMVAATRTR